MRLRGLCERIAGRDRHANLAVAEMTIQLLEFTRIRDRIERTHAKRTPLHWNRFDAVRIDDASFGSHEVETPLERVAPRERKHTIQSVGRECPELIDGRWPPRVDDAMSAELPDQTCRRRAGCGGDDRAPRCRELNRHRADGDETMINVPRLENATVRHFWGSELTWAPMEPGQHHRSDDAVNALWGLLDMTPDGRGQFMPKLAY